MAKPRKLPLLQTNPAPGVDRTVWYAEGLRFKCTQCGNCCSGAPGFVWVTLDDMERIAGHLKLGFNDFTKRYVRQIGARFSLIEKRDHDCIFLTREGGHTGCGIYPVRPMQCRTWPFWDGNLKSPEAWKDASERCPGMCDAEAPRHELEHIERCRQATGSPQ